MSSHAQHRTHHFVPDFFFFFFVVVVVVFFFFALAFCVLCTPVADLRPGLLGLASAAACTNTC